MTRFAPAMLAATAIAATLLSGLARADTKSDLIALDKKWGETGIKGDAKGMETLFAEKLVSFDQDVIRNKTQELATVKAEPAGTTYEPTDYQVTMLGDDMAIMTHGTRGKEAHNSLHVWSKKSGQWKVVATSSTPIKSP
jgi:hypothetical protein